MSTWNLDLSHSNLGFSVRHMVISKVRGEFARWNGTFVMGDGADPLEGASISVDVDVASIDTRVADRDGHLRSPDFFDTANHPTATFRSTRFEKTGASTFRVWGDLTIRGVTKEIALDAELHGITKDPWGNTRAGFSAETTLDRFAFGLHWNAALETGSLVVDSKVKVEIALEVLRAA